MKSIDPMFQLEAHLTPDYTEHFWVSSDTTWMTGGRPSISGVSGKPLDNLCVGFTLGYPITDNLTLTAGYMATVNDNGPAISGWTAFVSRLLTAGTRSSRDRSG